MAMYIDELKQTNKNSKSVTDLSLMVTAYGRCHKTFIGLTVAHAQSKATTDGGTV